MPDPMKAAVLTLSDAGSRGERLDTAGPAVAEMLRGAQFEVAETVMLPDDQEQTSHLLRRWADEDQYGLVVTTGGTGLAPRDRTPEATLAVIDYRVDGIAEAMRAAGLVSTPRAMLSRGLAGVRKRTLIINLPGSEPGARENLAAVLPVLQHATRLLQGDTAH